MADSARSVRRRRVDVVTEADFVQRRLDRLSAEHDPVLFATAYSCPVPSPDGRMLAWISDRDGRPRAWVAALPPDGGPVDRAGLAAATDRTDDVTACPGTSRGSPGRPTGYWLACQLAPGGGERTRVRLVTPDGSAGPRPRPERRRRSRWAPGRPSGRQLGITIFGGGSGDGVACLVDVRDGTSTMLASGPAARGLRGQRRRHARRRPRRPARRPPAGDWSTCAPAGAPSCSPAARRTWPTPASGSPAASCSCTPTPARERPALLAVGLNGDAEPSLPYLVAGRDDARPRPRRARPGGRAAPRWCGTSTAAARSTCWTCARASPSRSPARPATSSPARRSPATGARCWSATRARPSRRTITRIVPRSPRDDAPVTPLLPAAPRDAGHLVDPVLHHFPGEDGLPLSGWLFRPADGAFAPSPTLIWLHGGPEAQERPIFQPLFQALLAEGVAVFAPNVRGSGGYGRTFSQADDLDRRFVAITDVRAAVALAGRRRAGRPDPDRRVRPVLRRLPDAGRAGLVPGAVPGRRRRLRDLRLRHVLRRRPSRGSRRRPSPSTATRRSTPRCCASCRRSTAWTGSPRRCWWCTAPTTRTCRSSRPSRSSTALRDRGASPGFLLFDDEGHEVHSTENRVLFVREVVRWVTGHLLDVGEQTA